MIRYFIWMLLLGATERVWGQKCAKFLEKGQLALDGKDYDEAIRLFSLGKAVSDAAQCPALDSKLAAARRAKAALAEKPKPKPAKVEPSKPVASKPAPAAKVETPKPRSTAPNIEMVRVEGGTFQMGSNDGETNEKPIHEVTVGSFSIGKYEITQAQWRSVMGTSPSNFKNCDNCPVENVSWDEIQEFLSKLNSLSSKRYRLPTEAEWEYAARGGSSSNGFKYSGSNDLNAVAWYYQHSDNKTHSVGGKSANELGIFDMSGNVWEWCSDWYDRNYYSSSPSSNPTGAATDSDRVLRGGSWASMLWAAALRAVSATRRRIGIGITVSASFLFLSSANRTGLSEQKRVQPLQKGENAVKTV
jgi:formylglycine-generating enzyme required for sulfatase activity